LTSLEDPVMLSKYVFQWMACNVNRFFCDVWLNDKHFYWTPAL
jgi:hypothetical protein